MGPTYWWMLFGMALVTYLPRMIPLTILDGKELPPIVSAVLRNIPYAVLGALDLPCDFICSRRKYFIWSDRCLRRFSNCNSWWRCHVRRTRNDWSTCDL